MSKIKYCMSHRSLKTQDKWRYEKPKAIWASETQHLKIGTSQILSMGQSCISIAKAKVKAHSLNFESRWPQSSNYEWRRWTPSSRNIARSRAPIKQSWRKMATLTFSRCLMPLLYIGRITLRSPSHMHQMIKLALTFCDQRSRMGHSLRLISPAKRIQI